MQNKLTANNNFNYIGFILTVILLSFFPQASANLARITGITTSGGSVPELVYLHNDIMGTPVVGTDKNGNLLWQEERRAYGQIATTSATPRNKSIYSIGYTGHQEDNDSGLTYAKARYYNAEIGRFYAPDPLDFRESDPSSINRYSYAANNPYKYTDPNGREPMFGDSDWDTVTRWGQMDRAYNQVGYGLDTYKYHIAAGVIGVGIVAYAAPAVASFVAKEAASEALSVATGGASDVVTNIVSVRKIVKNVSKAADAARSAKGTRPPNLSPEGAGRTGAFKEAKRQSEIPTSQQPSAVKPNLDRRGKVQPGKVYEFEVPAAGGGTKTVKIRDDAGGHDFGAGNDQNRGSHFNNEAGDHFDY